MNEAIEAVREEMARHGYVADRAVATAVHLSRRLEKPLLVEGEAGVGKTEIGKVMAKVLDTELIRLQCYEGLDVHTAVYEWNYQKQLLRLRLEERRQQGGREEEEEDRRDEATPEALEETIFSRDYLLERPLLRAITRERRPVLLIDEIDRADEEFEAFLLELLSDFQISIPEIGTVRAAQRPYVLLTSNSTRELSDALRRRCLYLWLEHPSLEKELEILRIRVPDLRPPLRDEVTRFVQRLRREKLYKTPGVAETLDWARALRELEAERLDPELVEATLGSLLKDRHDVERVSGNGLRVLLEEALDRPVEEASAE